MHVQYKRGQKITLLHVSKFKELEFKIKLNTKYMYSNMDRNFCETQFVWWTTWKKFYKWQCLSSELSFMARIETLKIAKKDFIALLSSIKSAPLPSDKQKSTFNLFNWPYRLFSHIFVYIYKHIVKSNLKFEEFVSIFFSRNSNLSKSI